MQEGLLTLYSEVESSPVRWLWYPYIAIGKITLLQGDPGDGKSTMMMNLIAEITTGGAFPDGKPLEQPQRVIYQCSEDGVADTIKPRLEEQGADCSKVAFINEEVNSGLTLDDERIRDAIVAFRPRLVVIDPIQAYLSSDSDLQIAGKARRLMQHLGMWAATYDCAIVLIGHLNKKEGIKGLYRSLGSIDVVAAARSVLQIERDAENMDIRVVHQIKNSLGPDGSKISFSITEDYGFQWLDSISESCDEKQEVQTLEYKTKTEMACALLKQYLVKGDIVNEDEAETVKAIYYLYLNGVSFSDIAELLKAYKRKTKQGSYEWSASTLAEIVANERHCGDIRAWKTFTPNFLTHKAKKNNGERTQFRRKNHHEAIVSRTVYEAANFLRASRAYAKKARPLPVLSVVDNGILRGYVPLDKDWTGFSTDEYQKASESVMSELEDTRQIEYKAGLDMHGYEVVRSQYFSTTQNPAMTIADGKLCFNTACLKKFENVEYVELLLNSVNRCIAVRPCDGNNPNAIHWGKLREGRWCALSKSCRGLAQTLFDIMDWDQDLKYRFRGDFIENDDQKVMLFQLDEPEMVKTENIVLPPKEAEIDDRAEIAGRTVKQIINILPPEWEDTFGRPIISIGEINLLEQRHYAADWDVLRPAKELAEYSTLTSEDLEELLHEAEKIIEGWPIPDEHGAGESADNGDGESAGVGTECGADVGAGTEENGDRADL